MAGVAIVLLQQLLLVSFANAMLFKMDANGKQCISEDDGSEDVIVHATYNITSRPDPSCKVGIRVSVTRPPRLRFARLHAGAAPPCPDR